MLSKSNGTSAQDRYALLVREGFAPELRRLGFAGSGAKFTLADSEHWVILG
jgi:hypothetical protein